MINFPAINPVAFELGPLQVRWYGISYVCGILLAWHLLARRATQRPDLGWTREQVGDLIYYATLGVIIGGRLGSVLFYNLPYYLDNPVDILKVWQGGMSFHGGLIGVMVAAWYYNRRDGRNFFQTTDFFIPAVPVGLFFGRIANFINAELWGSPTTVPWGVVFPVEEAGRIARHPSQIYEALLEGLLLFIILWLYSSKPRPLMSISGLYLVLYGAFRSFVEFFREPDEHIGYLAGEWLTMGQVLSLPMIIAGGLLLYFAHRKSHDAK